MRRYLGMGAAWLGATALSIVIASAAVAGIRDRVVETPVAIGLPTTTTTTVPLETTAAPAAAETTTTVTVPTTTGAPIETTTTAPPSATETTVPAITTTTAAPVATTTTTAPPATTTTSAPIEYLTYDLVGGTVVLAVGNGEVNLAGATPRPGFSADYEHTGPKEVEIKFVSNDHKSKLEAKFEDGELKVETEEEDHGEGDGD